MSDRFIDKYVDLIGVLIITSTLSFLLYDVSKDTITGEVRYPGTVILQVLLLHGSYLSVFLAACSFDKFLKLPRWVWVSVIGSFACSLTYLEPLIDFDVVRSLVTFVGFAGYSVLVLGVLNFRSWAAKLLLKYSSGPLSIFPQGNSIQNPNKPFRF